MSTMSTSRSARSYLHLGPRDGLRPADRWTLTATAHRSVSTLTASGSDGRLPSSALQSSSGLSAFVVTQEAVYCVHAAWLRETGLVNYYQNILRAYISIIKMCSEYVSFPCCPNLGT